MPRPTVEGARVLELTGGRRPDIAVSAWVAPGATLVGSVELGEESSVWYGAVLRAERARIRLGRGSNLQDGVIVHVDEGFDATIGAGVSVGHNAVLHGCTVEDDAVDFYRRLGFTTSPSATDARWPDRRRYGCVLSPP